MPLPIYPGPASVRNTSVKRAFDVLMILPPDQDLSSILRRHKFPPQGPAIVAAALAPDNIRLRVVDLDRSIFLHPLSSDIALADDETMVAAYLQGKSVPAIEQLVDELIGRIADPQCDAFGLSLERYPQIAPSALIGYELKRRFGKPVILGGLVGTEPQKFLARVGGRGIDIATTANTPVGLRRVFQVLRELPPGRMELPLEMPQYHDPLEPETWPVPDYSIYRLDDYRRDPIATDASTYGAYDGALGPQLVLGYNILFNCLYACAFCTSARTPQVAKSPGKVVRDLAAMAERYDARDFAFMDTQINLEAPALAEALIAANLGVRWSDSYRVAPSKPGVVERMARAGCVGLTLGIESASNRMLKKMIKGYGQPDATRVLRETHDAGIMTRVNLLPCFPGETREDFVETRDWLADNAFAIDDLSASSFYLPVGTQIGGHPAQFGIRMREVRNLVGELRVRKNVGSYSYDEIDGLTWEEREPTLDAYEDELRTTWRSARARATGNRIAHVLTISHMNALRRVYSKAEAYDALNRWARHQGRSPDEAARPEADAVGAVAPRRFKPAALDAEMSERCDAALGHALPKLAKMLGRSMSGHMVVFDDGDYLCFEGLVERVEEERPRMIRIDNMLAYRFNGRRKKVYKRLSPGVTVDVQAATIRAGEGSGRWEEPLRLGDEYQIVSFGPA